MKKIEPLEHALWMAGVKAERFKIQSLHPDGKPIFYYYLKLVNQSTDRVSTEEMNRIIQVAKTWWPEATEAASPDDDFRILYIAWARK